MIASRLEIEEQKSFTIKQQATQENDSSKAAMIDPSI